MLLDHLSINALMNNPTILQLSTAYCTAIARNRLSLLQGQLLYYEHIHAFIKHICHIAVPVSPKKYLQLNVYLAYH